jgi:hypothetical protein
MLTTEPAGTHLRPTGEATSTGPDSRLPTRASTLRASRRHRAQRLPRTGLASSRPFANPRREPDRALTPDPPDPAARIARLTSATLNDAAHGRRSPDFRPSPADEANPTRPFPRPANPNLHIAHLPSTQDTTTPSDPIGRTPASARRCRAPALRQPRRNLPRPAQSVDVRSRIAPLVPPTPSDAPTTVPAGIGRLTKQNTLCRQPGCRP